MFDNDIHTCASYLLCAKLCLLSKLYIAISIERKKNRFADIKLLSKLSNFACSADKQVPIALSNKVNFFEPFPTNPREPGQSIPCVLFPTQERWLITKTFIKTCL